MKSINDVIADKLRAHTFDLLKIANSERKKVFSILRRLQQNLFNELVAQEITGERGYTKVQQRKMKKLFAFATETINGGYRDIDEYLAGEHLELAEVDSLFLAKAINTTAKVRLIENFITRDQARVIASETLIQGASSSEWWSRQATKTQNAFKDQVRQGVMQGDNLQQLTQRIVGGTRKGQTVAGIPKLMDKPRREAEALVRSSVMAISGATRRKLYEGNEDVIKGITQISTLDSRTSNVCVAYSGASWNLNYEPIGGNTLPYGSGVARHWNCRSAEVPILRSYEEITGKDIPEPPVGVRASLDGQVPADMTFDAWLKGKDKSDPGFPERLLGPTRANLWREGKITLQDLVNDRGGTKSVADLRREVGE